MQSESKELEELLSGVKFHATSNVSPDDFATKLQQLIEKKVVEAKIEELEKLNEASLTVPHNGIKKMVRLTEVSYITDRLTELKSSKGDK